MTLSALLMAGGESRRMGMDKATMLFEGEMLWQKQLRLLRLLQPQKLCVSARVVPAWCPADVETILDATPSRGPLSGIAAGLLRTQTTHLLVLAIDMPRISLQHLRNLVRLAVPGCGVVPRNADSFEPLCAIYPVEATVSVVKALANGNSSLQNLLEMLRLTGQMRAYPLSESELPLYLNLNTPADLVERE